MGVLAPPHLDGPGLGRVPHEVTLVLERGEMGVHRGAGRQADGLADLPHARRVAAAAHLGVDELEHLALPGGQVGHLRALPDRSRWRALPARFGGLRPQSFFGGLRPHGDAI